MRENVRRCFERHGMGILGRSIVTGALVLGVVGIGAGSAASANWQSQWQRSPRPWKSTTIQNITFTSTPPNPALVGGTYTVRASGGASGNPVTFSIDPSAKGSCSISGATVTFVAVGTCVIDANQAGNANYEAATQVQQSFAVARHPDHHLHLDPAQPGVVRRHLHPHGERRGQWQPGHLLDRPLGERSCSISGATVTFVAVGTCVIDANQAGNANYEAAPQVQQSFAVAGTQTITFTSTPPSRRSCGGTYTPTATGGASGNPVTFSIDPSANGAARISGATVTFRASGPASSTPTRPATPTTRPPPRSSSPSPWAGHPDHHASPRPRPARRSVGGTYTPTASGDLGPGNPVTFSIDSSAIGCCTISGAAVTFAAVGTCVIDANQAGNANYNAAAQVQQSFAVGRRPDHHLHLDPARPGAPSAATYTPDGDRRGQSGNPVTFSIDASAHGMLQHLGCDRHLRRRRAPASSTPTRPATPTTTPPPRSSSFASARHPDHHLHLDPAQRRRSSGRTYTLTATGGAWQPGHLLDRLLGATGLQHLGCDRHLRRRRDLRHRRQPGRQRQLRGGHPGPAVLRRGHGHPDHHLHLDPAQPAVVRGHLHPDGHAAGPVATRSPSRSTPRRTEAAASRVPPSPSSPSGPASSTPTRPATPTTRPPPRSSSPSPSSAPKPSPSPRPRPARRSWEAPTRPRRAAGASGNPVTFSIDPSAKRKLQHLGCDRHLRRRRDLRHRRQPGRQRQL